VLLGGKKNAQGLLGGSLQLDHAAASSSSVLLSILELSDTQVYEP